MHDLGNSVHAGIGAAGGDHTERVPGNLTDGVLERVLDAAARGLRLEATEREARVLTCEGNPHSNVSKSRDKSFLAIYSRRRSARKASGGRAPFV